MAQVMGIVVNRDGIEPQLILGTDMDIVGIVGTAPDANGTLIPLNTAIELRTNDITLRNALGDTGTIPDALTAISAQLTAAAAKCVIVRVADNVTANTVITNIVGDEDDQTGMWALLNAPEDLGVTPRIIIIPGYTEQHAIENGYTDVTRTVKSGGNTGNGVMTLADPAFGGSAIGGVYQVRCIGGAFTGSGAAKAGGNTGNGTIGSITAAGASVGAGAYRATCYVAASNGGTFVVEDPNGNTIGVAVVGSAFTSDHIGFTIADGATDFVVGDAFVITVVPAVPANGGVFSVVSPNNTTLANATVGVAYNGAHIKFTIADGSTDFVIGDGFDVTVAITGGEALANPVCAAIPTVLARLRAVFIPEGPTSSESAYETWLETLPQDIRILHPLRQKARALDADGYIVDKPLSPYIAGLYVRRDNEFDGVPGHSVANQSVNGLLGVTPKIKLDITNDSSEGMALLEKHAGIMVRGESGVDGSLADGGFTFWGTDTLSADTQWLFANVARMRDYMEIDLIKAERFYLGRFNITDQAVQAVLNTMDARLSQLRADKHIIDFRISFEEDQNTPEELRNGFITIGFQAEEPAPLRKITMKSRRYRPALVELVSSIAETLANLQSA